MKYLLSSLLLIIVISFTKASTYQSQIGTHLIIGINHYPIQDAWIKFINKNKISGIIFLSKSYQDGINVKKTIHKIKENIHHKMFFCIDQEGGNVSRIKKNVIQIPAAKVIAESYTEKEAFELYRKQAKDLAELGINVNFSPVLDILYNKANTVIGNRSFGNNPQTVHKYAKEVINASLIENIMPVIKHFPGHGYTNQDSHKEMPVHNNIERLIKTDLIPFKKSIQFGAPAIMIAHILYPKLDKQYPASLSNEIITNYLKNDLSFSGIIFSDDINMGAIKKHYNLDTAIIKSIEAGVHQTIIIAPLERLKTTIKSINIKLKNEPQITKIIKKNQSIIASFK